MVIAGTKIAQTPPYPSIAVANWFIENVDPVTPLKLQKLLYFAHGWHLALRDNPLIDELVEAWEYGPVIPSVYHEFKEYGNRAIITPGTAVGILSDINSDTRKLLRRIADVYGKYTAGELSTMTHQQGTPWFVTHKKFPNQKGIDIQDSDIKDYFRKLAKK